MRQQLQRLAIGLLIAATVGMFVVLVMGATVTNTGSGEGCGQSWPLCNGQFIPQFAVATAIEFSHRAVTGIEGMLIAAAAIGALIFWRNRLEIRILVALMIFFLLLQAGLGALAVWYPTSDEVLAIHFGVSLLAFASTLLVTLLVVGLQRGLDALRDQRPPVSVRWLIWFLLLYTYGVVYLGAYVNHTDSSLACLDWPLCNGALFPGFTGPVGIVFSHRLAALALTCGTLWLAWLCWQIRASRPDLWWTSMIAVVTLLGQSAGGAALIFTRVSLWSALVHGAIVALFFGALAYLCLQSLPRPQTVEAAQRAQDQSPRSYPGHTRDRPVPSLERRW